MVKDAHRFACGALAGIAVLAPPASSAVAHGTSRRLGATVRVAAVARSHDRATVNVTARCAVRVKLSLRSGRRTVSPTVAMSLSRGRARRITLPFGARGATVQAIVAARPLSSRRSTCGVRPGTTTHVVVTLRVPPSPAPQAPTLPPAAAPAPYSAQPLPTPPAPAGSGTSTSGTSTSVPTGGPLAWAPPVLHSPTVVQVTGTNHTLALDPSRDYLVQMPTTPLTAKGGLSISGGHNVVLVGGEIDIPWQGDPPPADSRRALYLKGQTGTVHIEGLRMAGPDISEGIDLDQRLGAVVQIEDVRIEGIHARDEAGFSDNHPDLIQTWAGPAELRVYGLTGSSDYQGFTFNPMQYGTQPPPRLFDLRHVNIVGTNTAGYLLWQSSPFPISTSDVWVQPNPNKSLARTLWPNVAAWPSVKQGQPLAGDFVPAATAGLAYSSPGYPAGATQ